MGFFVSGGGGVSSAEVTAAANAAEDAANIYTDTVFAAAAAADIAAIPFRSATLYGIAQHTGLSTGIPGNRVVNMLAFRPGKACTLSKVSVEQTIAGEAGSLIRLMIAEDLDGIPSDVLWQSTGIAGDGANGEKSADPNLAVVPSKLYYAGVQCYTATTTRPQLRYIQSVANGSRTFVNSQVATGRMGFSYGMGNDGTITDPLVAGTVSVGGAPTPMLWLMAD